MRPARKIARINSAINVTPLVDVVLVLLIIFMIVAPQMQADAAVNLPKTDQPPDKPENNRQIVVLIEPNGALWIDDEQVDSRDLPDRMRERAERDEGFKVVIKADSSLTFGEVQSAMFAIESAGFDDVGLIAERHDS